LILFSYLFYVNIVLIWGVLQNLISFCVAQSKENEEKRVTKEMAHIRKEFKENKGIDGYQRRKYQTSIMDNAFYF
jgi:hypothetical protein